MEWAAISKFLENEGFSSFRSRSLVVKCMIRYTVFLGTLRAFFVNLATLKVAKLTIGQIGHLGILVKKANGKDILTKMGDF